MTVAHNDPLATGRMPAVQPHERRRRAPGGFACGTIRIQLERRALPHVLAVVPCPVTRPRNTICPCRQRSGSLESPPDACAACDRPNRVCITSRGRRAASRIKRPGAVREGELPATEVDRSAFPLRREGRLSLGWPGRLVTLPQRLGISGQRETSGSS